MASSSFYDDFECDDDFEEEEEDDDDDYDTIDPESLGDWRNFRRNLAQSEVASSLDEDDIEDELRMPAKTSVSRENEDILSSQNEKLAEEYKNGVWAHEVTTVRFQMKSTFWFFFIYLCA